MELGGLECAFLRYKEIRPVVNFCIYIFLKNLIINH
jgi:hypothetical protein